MHDHQALLSRQLRSGECHAGRLPNFIWFVLILCHIPSPLTPSHLEHASVTVFGGRARLV